jgi:eukaryotic-like serine/threonine-protein kinase
LKKLGKYEVLGELGHGAMGIVYRARDPIINRLVALKTITMGLAGDPASLERFYREAQAAGGLQHPNIVTIYDMGLADDVPFIAMELVEGENLEQLIARKSTLAVTRKLAYAMQACRAFDFAHKRGIVHRDIKPGNVMVSEDGTVKVVDFGIARVLETSKTQTGMLIGTFAYMSPEQYHGEHANERSDIWSFGVLVYELLSYQRPFIGSTPASLMHSICNEEPVPLRTLLPECTEELEQTISKMLRKSPGERHDSMEDVLLDLDLICKALQSQSVIDLLNQGRQFLDQENFSEAHDVVRQALQLEASNQQARALLEKANAGLKRIRNRPRAQQLVEKGQRLLEQGKLQEAKAAAENALQLESGFAPAEALQCAIQKELDCAHAVAELLNAARQHLAEGLPDEADRALAKVLEIEPSNMHVGNLKQQVLKERAEREKGHRLQAALQHARDLWTRQDYTACIRLLQDLELEFPTETEIIKLLAAAREDLSEQEKQQKLSEARALLAAQEFEEAVALLDSLLAAHPKDFAVTKLSDLVEKERDKHSKAARIQRELDGVKALMTEKKYAEVIARTKELLGEFPAEPNFIRLSEFATERQASIEKEKLLQKTIEGSKAHIQAGRFSEAVRAAQDGRRTFPGDAELQALEQEATAQQKKQEVRRQIEQRVRDIRVKINREQLSDAIDLAKKTLATLGPDTDITHLLNSAEVEVQAREKKRIQEGTLETIRSMVSSGDLHGATEAIHAASKSNIWEAFDPRVQRLLEQIREVETKPTSAQATASPASAPTLLKEYAFFQPATMPTNPAASESTALVNSPPQPVHLASALPTEALEPRPLADPAELPPMAEPSSIAAPRAESLIELDRSAARSAPRATVEARRVSLVSARTVGVVAAIVLVIGVAVWIAADRPKPKLEQGSSNASSFSASQKTQPPKTPDSTNDTAVRNLLLQESAQAALATGDFRAARQAAEQLRQSGGDPAELLASINEAEQRELKKWEAHFEQVKHSKDSLAVQQLKTLQAKFQSAANDGGPQSAEASTYLNKVSATLRADESLRAKTATNPRCEALQERAQLGETLSDAERAFLRDSCH